MFIFINVVEVAHREESADFLGSASPAWGRSRPVLALTGECVNLITKLFPLSCWEQKVRQLSAGGGPTAKNLYMVSSFDVDS